MPIPINIFGNHAIVTPDGSTVPITDATLAVQFTALTPSVQNQQIATITEDYIMNIGSASSKGLTDLTSKILSSASATSGGEMGAKLDELIDTTKGMSVDNFQANPLTKFFNKALRMKDHAMETFQTANDRVNILVAQLEKERNGQDSDRKSIDALAQQNYEYCKAIIVEIDDAKEKYATLGNAIGKFGTSDQSPDFEQAKILDDLQTKYDMLEKKIVDLEANKLLSMNMEPKLKLMKQGSISLIGTFDNIVGKIVPLYMQQFAAYLIMQRQTQTAAVGDKAIAMFNQQIIAGSNKAAANAEAIAQLSQKQIIDVDTLKKDHENVVNSLDKVKQIALDARTNRKAIMQEIQTMEQDTINAFSKH
jgi:uncharacterized protein YaaN involved in tellurite resistance